MAKKNPPSSTKLFVDDEYLDSQGQYTAVPAPNPTAVTQKQQTPETVVDNSIRSIQQIVADSKAAREARQAAAVERKKELDAQREAAFAPIYERINTARENVLAIKERLSKGSEPEVVTPQPEPRKVVSDVFVGECGSRKRVITYSDGTSSTTPAPEDCGGGLSTSLIDTPTSVPTPTPVPPKPPAPPPPPPPPPKTPTKNRTNRHNSF